MSQQILPGVLGEAGPVGKVSKSFADRGAFDLAIEGMIPWIGHTPGTWREKRQRPVAKLYRTAPAIESLGGDQRDRLALRLSGVSLLGADEWKSAAIVAAGRLGLDVKIDKFSGTTIFANNHGQVLLVCLCASHPEFTDAVMAGVALAAAGAAPDTAEEIIDKKTGELLRVEWGSAFTLAIDAALEDGQPWAPALAKLVSGRQEHEPLIRSFGLAGRRLATTLETGGEP